MTWLEASVIVLLAAFCQSLTGFGFALILVPLLSLIWDVRTAVAFSLTLSVLINIPLLALARHYVDGRMVLVLLAGSLLGLPLGLRLLIMLDPHVLKLLIGIVVVLSAVLLQRGPGATFRTPRTRLSALFMGALSGALGTSTSMSGPPVILFLMAQDMGKRKLRGTLLAYFVPLNLAAIALMGAAGTVPAHSLWGWIAPLPALLLGLVTGRALCLRVDHQVFRRIVIALVILAGTLSASSGLMALR
jgi:hypothetical protein